MKKFVWKIKKVCGNCGKPFVPDKEAVIFGTKKWDGHIYKYNYEDGSKWRMLNVPNYIENLNL